MLAAVKKWPWLSTLWMAAHVFTLGPEVRTQEPVRFIRGDCNADGDTNGVNDALTLLVYNFIGGIEVSCAAACDADGDGSTIGVGDAIFLLTFNFIGGVEIPPPWPGCGPGRADEELSCARFPPCRQEPEPCAPAADPFLTTAEMNLPRYLHEALPLADGRVLVLGGSDEAGLSSLAEAELFDPRLSSEARPESGTGAYIDTDFEGEPIRMLQPRLYFTATELSVALALGGVEIDRPVVVAGGAANLAAARPIALVEVFDPLTRRFVNPEIFLISPRFRHTASWLPSTQELMVAGGQIHAAAMIPIEAGPGAAVPIDVFPSTRSAEVWSPSAPGFRILTIGDTAQPAELPEIRGRAGHAAAQIAGFDNSLRTADDLFVFAGGFNTPAGDSAPTNKIPGQTGGGRQQGVLDLVVYDPFPSIFSKLSPGLLPSPRINGPQAVNLGAFNEDTSDGVRCLSNMVLVANGDDDAPELRRTPREDLLFSFLFTGFGPAQGLQAFLISSIHGSHNQVFEETLSPGSLESGVLEENTTMSRSLANVVLLPRVLETGYEGAWVYAGAGVGFLASPDGRQLVHDQGSYAAGTLFDPFYNIDAILHVFLPPRDLNFSRGPRNPCGIMGTWLALDGELPSDSIDRYGDTPLSCWPRMESARNGPRAYTRLAPLPGPDGRRGTADDQVLISGGGGDPFRFGEPASPSSEIAVLPGR